MPANFAVCADVVIENYRPGSLERFGLSFDDVRVVNPGVVYCSISGFGSQGAGAGLPGYDFIVQAVGGLMSITGVGEPTKVGVAVVDVLAGKDAVVGILAAFRHRDATGEGQRVEVDLMSCLLSGLVTRRAVTWPPGPIRTASATGIRASRRTRCSRSATVCSRSPSAMTGSSHASRMPLGSPEFAGRTRGSRPTRTASPTAKSWRAPLGAAACDGTRARVGTAGRCSRDPCGRVNSVGEAIAYAGEGSGSSLSRPGQRSTATDAKPDKAVGDAVEAAGASAVTRSAHR